MRIKKKIEEIDYVETKQFFKRRAEHYKEDNPYSVTMYQDNNAELVKMRHERERELIYPLLKLNQQSRVLDIACGIGRWADVLPDTIAEYCGVDFSEELITVANKRNLREQFSFVVGSANNIETVLHENQKGRFNTVLLIGILMYLNDADLELLLQQVVRICDEHAIICIREPIGLRERLTLKDFYSNELLDNYNAIYRDRDELKIFFQNTLIDNGFLISHEGFVFNEDILNNRKETEQYYYIFER